MGGIVLMRRASCEQHAWTFSWYSIGNYIVLMLFLEIVSGGWRSVQATDVLVCLVTNFGFEFELRKSTCTSKAENQTDLSATHL